MPCLQTPPFRRALVALSLAGLVPAVAQAGLVTGAWDPEFGSFLPGLSWAVKGNFFVPDACANQADGDYDTIDVCAGTFVQSATLRLYDTGLADPNDFFQLSANSFYTDFQTLPSAFGYSVRKLRITAGQVVGFDAGDSNVPQSLVTPGYVQYTDPTTAKGNLFGMVFTLNGPEIECFACDNVNGFPSGVNNNNPSVFADKSQLEQFLITFNENGTAKQTTDDGRAVGARLDGSGKFLGLAAVPEPGSLGLGLAALAACAVLRRRR